MIQRLVQQGEDVRQTILASEIPKTLLTLLKIEDADKSPFYKQPKVDLAYLQSLSRIIEPLHKDHRDERAVLDNITGKIT